MVIWFADSWARSRADQPAMVGDFESANAQALADVGGPRSLRVLRGRVDVGSRGPQQ